VAGVDGATGATGVQGATGVVGVTGATGVAGTDGATGATGVAGVTGPGAPKAITILNPTTTEKVPLFYTLAGVTVSHIESIVSGTTPSVTFSVRHDADFSTTGTQVVNAGITVTNTTTGLATTAFDNATVSGSSFVWLSTSATSGTVDLLHVSVFFS
jgi:hypothetical protein